MDLSLEKLTECAAVLRALQKQPDIFKSKKCREIRLALAPFAADLVERITIGTSSAIAKTVNRSNRGGKAQLGLSRKEHKAQLRLNRKRKHQQERQAKREHDRQILASTMLFKTRVQKMRALEPAAQALVAPDGTAAEYLDVHGSSCLTSAGDECSPDCQRLHGPISCYVCHESFLDVHHFYHRLCPICAALNWEKRFQTFDMRGRRAVVTGARMKIGMHVALKLLRAGAEVIATTRYPKDAAVRFSYAPDFQAFKDRLHVFGVDFRYLSQVERFADFVKERFLCVDIIVNNAAQTIKRPEVSAEKHEEQLYLMSFPEGPDACQLLEKNNEFLSMQGLGSLTCAAGSMESVGHELALPSEASGKVINRVAPSGILDVNGREVDVATTNSWMLKLHEVSTGELAEVFLVNALAPFVLNARLQEALVRSPVSPRFVINVSAMEGQFYRVNKQPNHPHTNMAKAALNMMTRTSAQDLQRHSIFMNSVDTGWVNDEKPIHIARKVFETQSFQTPLDEIDAAASVLDPIFTGIKELPTPPAFGKFFKDYKETSW